jgi:hypothetical protein
MRELGKNNDHKLFVENLLQQLRVEQQMRL